LPKRHRLLERQEARHDPRYRMNLPEIQEAPAAAERREPLAAHTLVIPAYNRPALLKRLISYYFGRVRPMHVLVLDSSKPEIAAQNADTLAAHEPHVRHITFPTTVAMASKLCQGLALAETPTVSFCADDDLVFPEGLRRARAFLLEHPDHVSAHGLYLNFAEHGNAVHLMREYAGQSNDAAHPGARIFRLCQNYESLFYGVFRADDLRDIFSGVSSLPTLHYQELFQSVAALIKGKVHRFPTFYAARRSGPAAEPDRTRWQTYYWFAENPTEFLEHYLHYRDRVWDFYMRHGAEPRLDRDTLFKVLDVAHGIYFSTGCPPRYFHSVLQQYWPDDDFIDEHVDLFREIRHRSRPTPGSTERLIIKLLRRLRRWQRPSSESAIAAAAALSALDRDIQSKSSRPWKCELPSELKWLATNDDFRASYRELCSYLDALPQMEATQ
jgi:glycosyltransferase domain-containing protein